MRKVALFVEDSAHQQVMDALVQRLAREEDMAVQLEWRTARHGYGAVVQELNDYLRDLDRQGEPLPDLIIVATDANCTGLNERTKELQHPNSPSPIILAIPDPHIERWLLLDGAAFKAVFERGCQAPDQKCERARYKKHLIDAIYAAGVNPILGGIEYAKDIVEHVDIDRAERADKSFKRFVRDLRKEFRSWKS